MAWPTPEELDAWLAIPDGGDAAAAAIALDAAKSLISSRTIYGLDGDPPGAVKAATLLHAAKLYHRRNTPDGVQGSSEFGLLRTNRFDGDVETLIAPYLEVVCAIDDGSGDGTPITDIEGYQG